MACTIRISHIERNMKAIRKLTRLVASLAVMSTLAASISCSGDGGATLAEAGDFAREGVVFAQTGVNNMEVITLPDGRYRAFFHQGQSNVGSAVSNDGLTFNIEEGSRVNGSMPATVRLDDGRWRMYYSRAGDLASAISSDGFNFIEEPDIRLHRGASGDSDEFGIVHPSIVKLPDGTYRLYYDGQHRQEPGPHWRIMSARSDDGLTWVKDEGIRVPAGVESESGYEFDIAFSPHAEYRDGQYILYFTSEGNPLRASGIWRAASSDGVNFTVEPQPVLARDPQFGDEPDPSSVGGPKGMPQDPFLLTVPGGQRLFYWTSDKGYQSAFRPD
jgi:hypothetical protein